MAPYSQPVTVQIKAEITNRIYKTNILLYWKNINFISALQKHKLRLRAILYDVKLLPLKESLLLTTVHRLGKLCLQSSDLENLH